MKVVLFCGGYGMRMPDTTTTNSMPKPMQMVGPRPLLWHVMRYYAYFGHTDFILCLGSGASHVKDYFLAHQEAKSNDFVMRGGEVELLSTEMADWSITFVHTGSESGLGERLQYARPYLGDDEYFFANYADVLTDAALDQMLGQFHGSGAAAGMLLVHPQRSFHCADTDNGGMVRRLYSTADLPVWENGGYFILSQQIFEFLAPGCDLVTGALGDLAQQGSLFGYRHGGFWQPADTFRERAELDARYGRGDHPWMLWKERQDAAAMCEVAQV